MKEIANTVSISKRIIFILVLISLTSCDAMTVAPAAKSTCIPKTGGGFYDFPPSTPQGLEAQAITKTIFEGYSDNPQKARQEALRFLKEETRFWSYPQDSGEDTAQVRIIFTFITPELLQAIILAEALSHDPPLAQGYDSYMYAGFSNFKKRNEFVFLLTFLPEQNQQSNATFSIPPKSMKLHNTSDWDAVCTHSDDFLNGILKFSDKNQSGLVFFPIAVSKSGNEDDCSRVLDPEWDTSLMLNIANAKIGNQTEQPIQWALPFAPMVLADGTPFKVDLTSEIQPNYNVTFASVSIQDLPFPAFGVTPDDFFWRDYSRFVWGKLVSNVIIGP
jgi:hypothetical protein